ncbi:MAG: glycosyltransferase [Proteobacteria bacterium]|nr:glycosyltransferase [Pseudomonadota bacterium]
MADTLLMITTSYPRSGDGSEAAGSFVADMVSELASRVPVRVLAPGDRSVVENAGPGVTVHRFVAPQGNLGNLRLTSPVDMWRIFKVLRAGLRASRDAASDGCVGHVLACWALPSGWWALHLLRRHQIPYSVWMLGSDVWSLGRVPVVRGILRKVMRRAHRRYADGLLLADDSRRICGLDVDFLPSTRRLQAGEPSPLSTQPPYRLVYIGRWHPNKGIDLLLDALALLDDRDWERIAEVRIFGGGPMNDEVHRRAKPLAEVGRPVEVAGFITKEEAERAIVRADYLLIPSRIESIPVVFSDAMKLGRPVVAMPVGDFPALFAKASFGVLAKKATAIELVNALRAALTASPESFAKGVRCHASDFDLSAIADRLLAEAFGHG